MGCTRLGCILFCVYQTGVYLDGVYQTEVYLDGVYQAEVYLDGVYQAEVYLDGFFLFFSPSYEEKKKMGMMNKRIGAKFKSKKSNR